MRWLLDKLEQKPGWGLLVLLLVPTFIYHCWNAPFLILDDGLLIESHALQKEAPWGMCFDKEVGEGFYFPFTLLSWKLDRLILAPFLEGHFGIQDELQAWASAVRINNTILHLLNSALMWLILRIRLGASGILALFVTAAFALHPMNCESVCWAIERKNLISLFFCWCALFLYMAPFSIYRQIFALVFYGIALLCKPLALNLLPVIFVWEILGRPAFSTVISEGQTAVKPSLSMRILFLTLWVGASLWIVKVFVGTIGKNIMPPPGGSYFTALLTDFLLLQRYIWNLLVPVDLSMYYGVTPVRSLADGRFWISFMGCGIFIAALILLPEKKHRRMVGFATLWFLGGWGTNWNLVGVNDLMHDRFIYLAAPGFWIALSLALQGAVVRLKALELSAPNLARWTSKASPIALSFTLILALVWTAASASRGELFASSQAIFEDACAKEPRSTYAHGTLAQVYLLQLNQPDSAARNEALQKAIAHFEACMTAPDFDRYLRRPQAYGNLGSLYLYTKQFDLAEKMGLMALNMPIGSYIYDEDLAMANYVMGRVCLERQQLGEALEYFQKAKYRQPTLYSVNIQFSKIHTLFQRKFQAEQNWVEARQQYQMARAALAEIPSADPNFKEAQKILAILVAPPN